MTPQNQVCEIMLGLSPTISCNSCNEAYCCIDQKHIEISDSEFKAIKHLIGVEVLERARNEVKRSAKNDGRYTCPFLEDGRCSIYDNRFIVCAGYGVVTPKELCRNTNRVIDIEVISPMDVYTKVFFTGDKKTVDYLRKHSQGKQTDILKEFKKILGVKI